MDQGEMTEFKRSPDPNAKKLEIHLQKQKEMQRQLMLRTANLADLVQIAAESSENIPSVSTRYLNQDSYRSAHIVTN